MKHRLILFPICIVVIVALLLTLSLSAAQDVPKPEPVGLRPDAPPYALHGPYWVGTRTFNIDPGTEESLILNAWYPAQNPDGLQEEITYTVVIKDGTLPEDADVNPLINGHALRDASADTIAAPYPLIVFSPGFGAVSQEYAPLIEHWASYGFIVLSPEHRELFTWEGKDIPMTTVKRPQDIRRTLDYAEMLTEPGGAMDGLIDMEHVVVAGHSYGGYTALAAAGARLDFHSFSARCETVRATGDPNAWICDLLEPYDEDVATMIGLDSMPEGLWPPMGDPRVDAIITMAGDSYMFGQDGLAQITIPVLAMGGTMDIGTPYEWGVRPAFDYVSSETKALVSFEGGDHMIFGASCKDLTFVDGVLFPYWFCMDSVWDKARSLDLANHFSTAFLLDVLKGDVEAHTALAPDAVSFPGITYQAEGF